MLAPPQGGARIALAPWESQSPPELSAPAPPPAPPALPHQFAIPTQFAALSSPQLSPLLQLQPPQAREVRLR